MEKLRSAIRLINPHICPYCKGQLKHVISHIDWVDINTITGKLDMENYSEENNFVEFYLQCKKCGKIFSEDFIIDTDNEAIYTLDKEADLEEKEKKMKRYSNGVSKLERNNPFYQ